MHCRWFPLIPYRGGTQVATISTWSAVPSPRMYHGSLMQCLLLHRGPPQTRSHSPLQLRQVDAFLPLHAWEPFLTSHPDQVFTAFLHRGIKSGFQIGFDPSQELKTPPHNRQSVVQNSGAVSAYIKAEVAARKLSVPSDPTSIYRNLIGLIPRPYQPGKFCLSVDLLATQGGRVNDGIDPGG